MPRYGPEAATEAELLHELDVHLTGGRQLVAAGAPPSASSLGEDVGDIDPNLRKTVAPGADFEQDFADLMADIEIDLKPSGSSQSRVADSGKGSGAPHPAEGSENTPQNADVCASRKSRHGGSVWALHFWHIRRK